MPFAVTHVLTSIICVDLYRDYFTKHKKHFTLFTILIAGIGGLLPDIDVPLSWGLSKFGITATWLAHRTVTHTPVFALLFLILGIILWCDKKQKLAILFLVVAFGILLHIFLDLVLSPEGSIMLLWPFSTADFSLGLLTGAVSGFYAALDAILLLAWLTHEEIKHKIKDFI
ncbi:metal-dependent hydrolase [Candidatus Woesearchaeota archaeon]|nr:metal-dependent hydrolase [Candidatus Woesearchaeota archaeon]